MMNLRPVAALLALSCAALPALAASDDEFAALRAELQTLKSEYVERVAALEDRLKQLESSASSVTAAPAVAAMPSARSAATAFNPAISMILAGNYTHTSEDPESWHIAGFLPGDGEAGPGERGFNLGESEIALSANVDPYFSGTLIAAISGADQIEVEEAYVRTLGLPAGFTAKGGRFFSGFGYLNEAHAHTWDFVDQPLVYQALFGNQRAQEGVQLKWLAPTDLFFELGVEAGNGAAFPGTRRNRNGLNGTTAFVHVGGDLGESTSWRAGASWIELRAADRAYDDVDAADTPVLNSFSGTSRTWVIDGTLKWTPAGNTSRRQLKVQGEYMHRRESGALVFDSLGVALADSLRSEPTGWYLQSVYQFLPRWRAGLRYDELDSGKPRIGLVDRGVLPLASFPALLPARPQRTTLMFDWNPSEFSRLRAQYAWDDARGGDERDRQFQLQYLFGIGAHSAHRY